MSRIPLSLLPLSCLWGLACEPEPTPAPPAEPVPPAPVVAEPEPAPSSPPPTAETPEAQPAPSIPAAPAPGPAPTLEDLELRPLSCHTSRTRKPPGLSPLVAPKGKVYLELRTTATNPSSRRMQLDGLATLRQEGQLAVQDTMLMKEMAKGGHDYARFARPLTIDANDEERVAWVFLVDEDLHEMVMEIRDPTNTHRIVLPVTCDPRARPSP